MRFSKWIIHDRYENWEHVAYEYGVDPIVAKLISSRGISADEDINMYLRGTVDDTYKSQLMCDMDKACHIIIDKIKNNSKIRIISDYDVDGICSNYILFHALSLLSENISYEIPHRAKDGYGINERIIKDAMVDGVDTIITCDNGIAAMSAIKLAKDNNITVVVTDHHEQPYDILADGGREYKLPVADAVVNIKRHDCRYPYKGLCGAGVAYKFIRRLYEILDVVWEDEDRYMDILAIATVCDVMNLDGENRIFVKRGMKVIANTKIPGLKALLHENNLIGKQISAYILGFVIGPCLNAPGRLDDARESLLLLLEKDYDIALERAKKLIEYNNLRKEMTEEGVKEAFDIVEKTYRQDTVLVVYLPKLHESLAGIVAGKIKEKYYRPTFVITDSEGDVVKGSCRSIAGYNVSDALTECDYLLLKYGGHAMAGGFSLYRNNIDAFRETLNKNQKLTPEILSPYMKVDMILPIESLSYDLIEELNSMEPFGNGNEKPVFLHEGLKIISATRIGNNKQYLKLKFADEAKNVVEAMEFDAELFIKTIKLWFGDEECDKMLRGLNTDIILDVAYYPEINEFRGIKTIQIKPKDYKKRGDQYEESRRLH